MIKSGDWIYSTSLLNSTIFEKTKILICEVNNEGSWGYIMNKIFPKNLNELTEFQTSLPFPMYNGGPVENEKLFFVHLRPDLIEDSMYISNNYYLNGDFKKVLILINDKKIEQNELKLLIGYCGWDKDQLENEIEEGCWIVEQNKQNPLNN